MKQEEYERVGGLVAQVLDLAASELQGRRAAAGGPDQEAQFNRDFGAFSRVRQLIKTAPAMLRVLELASDGDDVAVAPLLLEQINGVIALARERAEASWETLADETRRDLEAWAGKELDGGERMELVALVMEGRFSAWNCPSCSKRNFHMRFPSEESAARWPEADELDLERFPGNCGRYSPNWVALLCDECRESQQQEMED